MADLDLQIRTELTRYLSTQISLHEFRDWFLPTAWNADARADGGTAELVHEIELMLSEFEAGHWLESEVRERLAPLVTAYTFGTTLVTSDTSSRTEWTSIQATPGEPGLEFADIRFLEAFA
jgi:hypothetical protein